MSSFPRPRRAALASLAGCALLSTALAGAGVAPAAFAAPSGEQAAVLGAGSVTSTAIVGGAGSSTGGTVTLITGDTAYLSVDADGVRSVVLHGADGKPAGDVFTRSLGDDLYAIPLDVADAVAEGRVDQELFNVTGLVRQGYGDVDRDTLPLIVRNANPQTRADVGLTRGAKLESISATAVTVAKEHADDALASLLTDDDIVIGLDALIEPAVLPATAPAPDTTLAERELDPATGVEQTGADEAWAQGHTGDGVTVAVLDTGWDTGHPDLVDRVVAAKDFTGSGTVQDQVGHGTHVAGTVAGDGSLDESRTGMAPEADLLIGKVLGPNGGQQSTIIEGAEWAVASGADIVNLSLGSRTPMPCDDPVAEAVSRLGDDALFVISAGNLSTRGSVTSPGCVEEALTVGAVDSAGDVASFSSRGAVVDDHRVKPDVSAPGVDIVSAWAGRPGGVGYRAMSGTSMAAPHVAGAAALVLQAHPDWDAQQLKRALAGSVKGDETSTVYEEGSGELWVPGAIDATVASDVSVSLGAFDWPHGSDERVSQQVTYANTGKKDITLSLRVDDVEGANGAHVPSSLVRVSPSTVTVPAGGSAEVTVAARGDVGNLKPDAYGEISARLVAKAGARTHTTTAVGMWLAPQTVPVDIEVIDRNGAPAAAGILDIVERHAPGRGVLTLDGSVTTASLRVGTYSIGAYVRTVVDGRKTWTYVSSPELQVAGDTKKITLDAREATRISADTPQPMTVVASQFGMSLAWDRWDLDSGVTTTGADLFVTPTARVKDAEFSFAVGMRGVAPDTAVAESPYIYNLAFVSDGRIDDNQQHTVRERDLAVVEESWFGQLGSTALSDAQTITPEGWRTSLVGGSIPIDAPTDRTAYYTPGVAWRQSSSAVSAQPPAVWFDPRRSYEAGQTSSVEWFRLPSCTGTAYDVNGAPARVGERQGSLIGFSFPQWQDTAPGRFGMAGFAEVGNTALWVDGAYRGSVAYPYVQADIGEGDHEVKVRVILTKLPRFGEAKLSSASFTTFTFDTAQPEGGEIAALPVVFPRYDAPVDEQNRAPREKAFPITIGAVGQDGYDPGEWSSLTVRMTSKKLSWSSSQLPDQDPSWVEVPVEKRDGAWVALVDQSEVPAGSTISLAVEGVDAHGAEVEQYLLDLYQVQ